MASMGLRRTFCSARFVLALTAISIFLRLFFLHPTYADENFYFNVAKQVANGVVPYKDFFFAHPPLQIYLLAALFKTFGTSLAVGKLVPLVSSSLSALAIYFIAEKIYDKKTALFSASIFLVLPPFVAFSVIENGVFTAMLFFLLSIYFFEKNNIRLSALLLVLSSMFRFTVLFYIPVFLIFYEKKKIIRFLVYSTLILSMAILLCYSMFGYQFIADTMIFHVSQKIGYQQSSMQYWSFGFFFIFIAALSALQGVQKKDKKLILLSVVPIIIDLAIIFSIRTIFYHYFLISLPFLAIAIGRSLSSGKDILIKIFIIGIVIFSLYSNIPTLDLYLNPSHAKNLDSIADFVQQNTKKNDFIFGEPTITNYISFKTNLRMPLNYMDSFMQHINFEGEEKLLEKLKKEKPAVFIELGNDRSYYLALPGIGKFVKENYVSAVNFTGVPNYEVFKLKSSISTEKF